MPTGWKALRAFILRYWDHENQMLMVPSYYAIEDFLNGKNHKAVRQCLRASEWALSLCGKSNLIPLVMEPVLRECNHQLKRRQSQIINSIKESVRWGIGSNSPNWKPEYKKLAKCDDRILGEIWKPADSRAILPNHKIGIELECEKAKYFTPFPGWDSHGDGSLHDNGVEYVSPPLEKDVALLQFREVVTAVKDKGAVGRDSCGLHVHFGLDPKDIPRDPWNDKTLREKEKTILDFIKSHRNTGEFSELFTERRYNNSYCRPDPSEPGARYRAVNFCSLSKHGTIEIRFCAVAPDLNDKWVNQFNKFVDWLYSVIHATEVTSWDYESGITFSLLEVIADSKWIENYYENRELVQYNLADL